MFGSRAWVVAVPLIAALACDRAASGVAASSAAATATAAASPAPVGAPRELDACAVTDRHVVLRWQPAPGSDAAGGYEVLEGGRVLRASVPLLDDRAVRPARTYCYAVRALDAAGNPSPPTTPLCIRTPDLAAPTAPGAPAAAPEGLDGAVVSWSPAQDDVGVAGYEVLRDGAVVARAGPMATHAVEAGLSRGQEHCWTVRARDGAGNASPAAGPACARTPEVRRARPLGAVAP